MQLRVSLLHGMPTCHGNAEREEKLGLSTPCGGQAGVRAGQREHKYLQDVSAREMISWEKKILEQRKGFQ